MKKLLILSLLFVSFVSLGQVLRQPKGIMWFWEYTDPNCSDCPILIFLPGSGERSNTPNFSLIQRNGLPKLLKAKGVTYLQGFTVLVPQQTTNVWGYVRDPKNPDIIKFLSYVKANYKSEDRFLTGLSMGGDGSWDGSYNGLDTLISAMVPVSGKGDYNLAKITAQRGISVWSIHGSSDTTVPYTDGKRPINGMLSIGSDPIPMFTLIYGGTHGSSTWDVAYSLTDRAELGGTTIYKWLLSKVKPKPIDKPGLYLDGKFCGTDSCRVDNHLITLKK